MKHDNEGDKAVGPHYHEAKCWKPGTYEPCVEHHAHSWECGHGELGPGCPQFKLRQARQVRRDVVKARSLVNSIKRRSASAPVKRAIEEALDCLRRAETSAEVDIEEILA